MGVLSGGALLQQEKLRENKRQLKGERERERKRERERERARERLHVAGFLEQFCV